MTDATAAPYSHAPLSALAALRALGRRLTGPILDKELRVASRRGRTYVLRTAYVLALVGIVALTMAWVATVRGGAATPFLAESARRLAVAVAWLQFFAAQLMAVAMLGNTVGDEQRLRTLDVLLATPLTGTQFVVGVGLYCSARCRTSTAAIAWTLGVVLGGLVLSQLIFGLALMVLFRFLSPSAGSTFVLLAYYLSDALLDAGLGFLFLRATVRRLRRSA